jgi:predicted membrane channel-forming protein YqfA (hemolysin III family)
MNDTFLYTLPQWFIFAAVFVVVYGWIEHKKPFRIIGAFIFIALGIFALFVFAGNYLAAGQFLTLEEIADQELTDDAIEEIPFQAKLLPAYISFIVSAVLAIPAIFLDIKNKKEYQWFIILAGLVSLFGFFIIVGVLKYL